MYFHRLNDLHSLRQLTLADAEELIEVVDANRAHLRQWLPWLDRTRTVADTRGFIENTLRQDENNQGFQAAIRFEGRLVGVVGYHRIDWHNRNTSLGYWLTESHQGRGLMTRSCEVLIDHGFAALNLHRISITCATGNIRSRAIPERLGLVHEGTVHGVEWLYDHYVDHEIYAQLQPEWQTRMIVRLAAQQTGPAPARP